MLFLILLLSVSKGICAGSAPAEPLKIACFEIMPHYHIGTDNQPRGIIVDFWNLWSEKTGVPVSFHTMSFAEMIEKVGSGEMDMIMGQIRTTNEYDKDLEFTHPLYNVSGNLFSRVGAPLLQRIEDLAGVRIGLVKNSPAHSFVRVNQPRAAIRLYDTYEELVQSAVEGEVDYFLMLQGSGMTYLAKHDGVNLFRMSEKPFYTLFIQSAVRKGNTELLNLINRGISATSSKELDHIIGNWTGDFSSQGPALYSQFHKVTVACDKDSPPLCFTDEKGGPKGLAVDIWRLWSERTGIPIEFVPASLEEAVELVGAGKVDAQAFLPYSSQYLDGFDFASPFVDLQSSFFFHKSIFGLKGPKDLKGFKIGILKGLVPEELVRKILPEVTFSVYSSVSALLGAIKNGEIRVFVGPTDVSLRWLDNLGLQDEFRFHAQRPLYTFKVYAALKKGNLKLEEVVREGMELITPDERASIERKWFGKSGVKTKDTLIVAMPADLPPLTFLNQDGEPAGMFVDIWRLWAQKTGQKIEFHSKSWKEANGDLVAGRVDINMGLLGANEREEPIAFVNEREEPIASYEAVYEGQVRFFFDVRQVKVPSIDELSGKELGVIGGTYPEKLLWKRYPNLSTVPFDSIEDMIPATQDGKIQGFVAVFCLLRTLSPDLGWPASLRPAVKFSTRESTAPGFYKIGENSPLSSKMGSLLSPIRSWRTLKPAGYRTHPSGTSLTESRR